MKLLLCAASLSLFPALATAQGETLGAFFDTGATQTTLSVSPFEPFNIYFIAQNVPIGIAGYEFLVNVPPEIQLLSATAYPDEFNTLDIDSSLEGFIVGIGGACLTGSGPIILAEVSCWATQQVAGLEIWVGPSVPSSFGGTAPGYAECGTLVLHPFADAYPGPAIVDVGLAATCQWYCGSGVNAATDGYVINTPAVLGGILNASVAGCNPANAGAILFAYASPLAFPTAKGEVLINFADPIGELMGMPSAVGSPAVFNLPVPGDAALVGIEFYTQAASFGGGFCLHCAHQCTLGY